MKYFIPAWYHEEQWWQDCSIPFYNKKHQSEFDDMISLMNMHQKNQYPFKLILLNYHSNLRTFLHRHQLYEVDYWSLFDELQGFKKAAPKPIDYRKFDWPVSTEFIYTSFIIKAVDGNKVTNIYYNAEGYLIWMEQFVDNIKVKRFVFDDRGYLSSIIDYTSDLPAIHYLNVDGEIILSESMTTGRVEVRKPHSMLKERVYHSMFDLIESCWEYYPKNNGDVFIAAADNRHNSLISRHIRPEQLTFSVFSKRNSEIEKEELSTVEGSHRLIVDTIHNEHFLQSIADEHRIFRITPFDAEVLPSVSSQLYVNYIGLLIDGLTDDELHELLDLLEDYLEGNSQLKIKLMTREYVSNRNHDIMTKISSINQKFIQREDDFEDLLDKELKSKEKIQWVDISNEINIVKWMAKLRIMLDLTAEPDLYIQISAISAGVPQINRLETDYVSHEKNGYIIESLQEIPHALNYFLKQLKHWNEAYSYSMALTNKFSSVNIIEQLDRFIKGEQHETSIQSTADRQSFTRT